MAHALRADHDLRRVIDDGREVDGLDEADLLLEWIPGSRLHVITGAGHWPQWEKPEEFNQVHVDFLLGHDERRPIALTSARRRGSKSIRSEHERQQRLVQSRRIQIG